MRLDHLLAADPIGTPLSDAQRARVDAVLGAFAFVRAGEGWQLDEAFAWASVTPVDGLLHVAVATPLPAHLVDVVHAALDGLVRETGLVRIDPLTRGELTPMDWVQRLAASASAGRGQRS